MLKFWTIFEKKFFFILKLKNIKILDEFEKNFFYFEIKKFEILDDFLKKFFLI